MSQLTAEPTPLDLIALNRLGYEVWASEALVKVKGHWLPRLLIVVYEESEPPLLTVIDPLTNEEMFSADDYLEIIDYLCESEYTRVEGQMEINSNDEAK